MESAKNTAMMDLYILNRIALSCGNSKNFTAAYNFVLLRDYCLVFEEIVNAFEPHIQLNKNVKKIRQNIKLFGKRGSLKNDDIYLKIRKVHEESFASYENNIGLYLDGERIIGSTVYNTFIFLDSEFENPYLTMYDSEFKEKLRIFFMETMLETRMELEPHILNDENIEFYKNIPILKTDISREVRCFDVRAEKFFEDEKNSLTYQTLQFRLLICLQELNYMIHIYKIFIENTTKKFSDEYTFMRVLTRGLDSILKNINNLFEYSNDEFIQWTNTMDEENKCRIQELAKNKEMILWTKKYRDMIHYDTRNENSNFLDVMTIDDEFKHKCYEVYDEVVVPLQKSISEFFIVTESHRFSFLKMLMMKLGQAET
ncbi:hypothetical protein [Lysinibacillus xylanilyticus]|uniref:hypothetical protein n=1 Tax=Lysinibacillus xylanilyticus TaxID=582475 RepID=UPI00083C945D|nr:hypothetical protein [Lysinibacillus xylanilyticus]